MSSTAVSAKSSENLNIVIVGHVDHGKSTLLGRLYADTGSLPDGKLEKVQAICKQQGKEFEYAFLFDAFLEEQEQGITIDTARTFFIWKGRQYIIIDAPGHKEFLKNMISGAARAEAALLLIDALEGVKEQSKKHGYLLSLLGVRQFAVVVNKMDLVGYRQDVLDGIEKEYREFLGQFGAVPQRIIPVSAKLGDNIAKHMHLKGESASAPVTNTDPMLASGVVGPNLTHLFSRGVFAGATYDLNEANLRLWLEDTQAMKPGNDMLVNLSQDDIDALVAYLTKLK